MGNLHQDTIFALATAPGKSGVAIIRISGSDAYSCLAPFGMDTLPPARLATLVTLRHGDEIIDQALTLLFKAPHSFTGEDSVEFHLHGSRAVIRKVLDKLAALPSFRIAEPGEFSRRAFLNGKMDLTAAEGLADMIDAETEAQRKQAVRLMRGESAVFYSALRTGILHALAYLEAYIDFPEEDIPDAILHEIHAELERIRKRMALEIAKGAAGNKIRDGVMLAIAGPPNAGKSSLMNLLAGDDVAIVSTVAGTTRDIIEIQMDIGGYAVWLADTAGIREHGDEVEREGIRRALAKAAEADITLLLLDVNTVDAKTDAAESPLWHLVKDNTLVVVNKCDASPPLPPLLFGRPPLPISVKHRYGIDALLACILKNIESLLPSEASFVTHARQQMHLQAAYSHLNGFASSSGLGLECQCEDLRRAATEIGKITGQITVDELLGHIFSRFCIGK